MCVFIFVRRIFCRLLPFALVVHRLLEEEGGRGLRIHVGVGGLPVVNILPGPVAATSANDVNKAGPKSTPPYGQLVAFLGDAQMNKTLQTTTVFLGGFRFVCCVALIALHSGGLVGRELTSDAKKRRKAFRCCFSLTAIVVYKVLDQHTVVIVLSCCTLVLGQIELRTPF